MMMIWVQVSLSIINVSKGIYPIHQSLLSFILISEQVSFYFSYTFTLYSSAGDFTLKWMVKGHYRADEENIFINNINNMTINNCHSVYNHLALSKMDWWLKVFSNQFYFTPFEIVIINFFVCKPLPTNQNHMDVFNSTLYAKMVLSILNAKWQYCLLLK